MEVVFFFFSNGSRYEGEFVDSKKQEKGIYFLRTLTNNRVVGKNIKCLGQVFIFFLMEIDIRDTLKMIILMVMEFFYCDGDKYVGEWKKD